MNILVILIIISLILDSLIIVGVCSRILCLISFVISGALKLFCIKDIIYKNNVKQEINDAVVKTNDIKFTYFDISDDLNSVYSYSSEILNIFRISEIGSGRHLLNAIKSETMNYMCTSEIEYNILFETNFIIHTNHNESFLVNVFNIESGKKCILHDISNYFKLKDGEILMNMFLYKIIPRLFEYIEVHNYDNIYTSNLCGPINLSANSNIDCYHLSNDCSVYISRPFKYDEIIYEFKSEMSDSVCRKIINRIGMKVIHKGRQFFSISEMLNELYLQYNIDIKILNKCDIHGNKQSIKVLLEFFIINNEIPMLNYNNNVSLKIQSKLINNDNVKCDIMNLLSFHGYEFVIEKDVIDILNIVLLVVNFHIVNDEESSGH